MWVVRASDYEFVEVEKFKTFNEALEFADKMGEIFGSYNVDLCEI